VWVEDGLDGRDALVRVGGGRPEGLPVALGQRGTEVVQRVDEALHLRRQRLQLDLRDLRQICRRGAANQPQEQ
jgi:hypothetical protein